MRKKKSVSTRVKTCPLVWPVCRMLSCLCGSCSIYIYIYILRSFIWFLHPILYISLFRYVISHLLLSTSFFMRLREGKGSLWPVPTPCMKCYWNHVFLRETDCWVIRVMLYLILVLLQCCYILFFFLPKI